MNKIRLCFLILGGMALLTPANPGQPTPVAKEEGLLGKILAVAPPPSAIRLKSSFSFPKNAEAPGDEYFWDPYDLASDEQGDLYISDRSNTVFKYSPEGTLLAKIGRSGQGPGDLGMPFDILISAGQLVVKESANQRVQFFDVSGISRGSIKLYKTYCSFGLDNRGRIYGIPLFFRPDPAQSLVDVISSEGRLERGFGRMLDFPNDFQQLNLSYIFINEDKEAIVVFAYMPIMRRYALDGRLLAECPLQSEMFELKRRNNLSLYARRPDERVAYIRVAHGASLDNGRLYLTDFVPPRLWINEIDLSGKVCKTYWANAGEHFSPVAVVPRMKDDHPSFYVLTLTPDPRVFCFDKE